MLCMAGCRTLPSRLRASRRSSTSSFYRRLLNTASSHAASSSAASRTPRYVRSAASSSSSSSSYDYDLLTIGAGSGGVRCSRMSSGMGAKVGVIEMPLNLVSSDTEGGAGGTCVLRGCVPKKLFVYGGEYKRMMEEAKGFGWHMKDLDSPSHDWQSLMSKKNTELLRLNGIYKNILSNAKVEYIEGRGTLVSPHEVDVDGKIFSAKNILIAVGGTPFIPSGIIGKEHCITSDEALVLKEPPKKIVIVGGGYIALEFAGIFHNFGAETHVVFRQDKPLRGFDEEVRDFVMEQMEMQGIHFHPSCTPEKVIKDEETGLLALDISSSSSSSSSSLTISGCDQVMMATGRRPKTAKLGLESCGVATSPDGAIIVDEYSQTNVPSVYAIGDVTNRINLTPVALHEGMALSSTLFGGGGKVKPDHKNVASAVFCDPSVSTVGLTEEEACETYKNVDVYTSTFRPMKNTISGVQGKMFMKLLVDADSDKVIGVHIAGPESAEIMQGVAIAVKMGATKKDFDATIGIHPTAAEELVTMRSVTREVRKETKVMA